MNVRNFFRALLAACTFIAAAQANANAILQVDGNGILTGAKGVTVLDKKYDVTFIDGSCPLLFAGCDTASDFTFQNIADAKAAATALLAEVFIDSGTQKFDYVTNKIVGCTHIAACNAVIPFGIFSATYYSAAFAVNNAGSSVDSVETTTFLRNGDFTGSSAVTYAKFQLAPADVPEPNSIALTGVALAGLAFVRRRKS